MRHDLVGGALLALVCAVASCSDDSVHRGADDLPQKRDVGASDTTRPPGELGPADRRTGTETAAKARFMLGEIDDGN